MPVNRQYWLRQARVDYAGTDLHGPAAAHLRRSRARQLDPGSRAAVCRQPVGRDQADPAGAGDRQRRARALRRAPATVLEPHEADLRRLVEATPDLTLAELQTELQRRCGVRAGLWTRSHNALRRVEPQA